MVASEMGVGFRFSIIASEMGVGFRFSMVASEMGVGFRFSMVASEMGVGFMVASEMNCVPNLFCTALQGKAPDPQGKNAICQQLVPCTCSTHHVLLLVQRFMHSDALAIACIPAVEPNLETPALRLHAFKVHKHLCAVVCSTSISN